MGSGYEKYWRCHPRKECPNCGKKTFVQPSDYYKMLWEEHCKYQCYRCGYVEGQPLIIKVKRTKAGNFQIEGRYGQYDGDAIWETKDCAICPFKRKVSATGEENIVGVCAKGVAWKVIIKRQQDLRKCDKKQKGGCAT